MSKPSSRPTRLKKRWGQRDENARAVSCVGVSTDGSAMGQVAKYLESLLDDRAALLPLDVRGRIQCRKRRARYLARRVPIFPACARRRSMPHCVSHVDHDIGSELGSGVVFALCSRRVRYGGSVAMKPRDRQPGGQSAAVDWLVMSQSPQSAQRAALESTQTPTSLSNASWPGKSVWRKRHW